MYFSFAALAPKDEEPEAMLGMQGLNPEEEELGPSDEEDMGDEQEDEQLVGKPTAPDLAGSADGGPSAIPDEPTAIPVVTPEHLTLERRAPEEPTALTPTPLVAKLMPRQPVFRRLREKNLYRFGCVRCLGLRGWIGM